MAKTFFNIREVGIHDYPEANYVRYVNGTLDIENVYAQFADSTFFLEAKASGYGDLVISWEAPLLPLADTLLPVDVSIRWSMTGEPQTIEEGTELLSNGPGRAKVTHTFPTEVQGKWVYLSMFLRHTKTTTSTDLYVAADPEYYELVASLAVLMPYEYGSIEDLWARIPLFMREQDTNNDLYDYLRIFAWDLDYVRTIVDYLMVQRDPQLASTYALQQMMEELGTLITTVELGATRARNYMQDVIRLRLSKGTEEGITEAIQAISGSRVHIDKIANKIYVHPQRTNLLRDPRLAKGVTDYGVGIENSWYSVQSDGGNVVLNIDYLKFNYNEVDNNQITFGPDDANVGFSPVRDMTNTSITDPAEVYLLGKFLFPCEADDTLYFSVDANTGYENVNKDYNIGIGSLDIVFADNKIWAIGTDSNLYSITPSTGVIDTYPIGGSANSIIYDETYLWVSLPLSSEIQKIDPADGSVISTYTVGTAPRYLAFDGTYIWVSDGTDLDVHQFDPSTGFYVSYPTGATTNVWGMAYADGYVWGLLPNEWGSAGIGVVKIDATTGDSTLYELPKQPGTNGIAYDGTYIWITSNGGTSPAWHGSFIMRINPDTGIVEATRDIRPISSGEAALDSYISDLIYAGGYLWASDEGVGVDAIYRISTDEDMVTTYPLDYGRAAYGITSDTHNIWIANAASNNVTRLLNVQDGTDIYSEGCFQGLYIYDSDNNIVGYSNDVSSLTGGRNYISVNISGTPVDNMCYMVLWFTLQPEEYIHISSMILENGYIGEYFDGNTNIGGWLNDVDTTEVDNRPDYGWHNRPTDTDPPSGYVYEPFETFAIYTSDRWRTNHTLVNVLPSIIPVTCLDDYSLEFDWIPAYSPFPIEPSPALPPTP